MPFIQWYCTFLLGIQWYNTLKLRYWMIVRHFSWWKRDLVLHWCLLWAKNYYYNNLPLVSFSLTASSGLSRGENHISLLTSIDFNDFFHWFPICWITFCQSCHYILLKIKGSSKRWFSQQWNRRTFQWIVI